MWALEATFIKSTTDTITQFGVPGMFARWPVYALALGGGRAPCCSRRRCTLGRCGSAAVPGDHRSDRQHRPSVWLFREHFVPDAAVLAIAALAFVVMCAGVVVMTRTAPATMQASPEASVTAS